jgi:cell volume regulation protein A
VAQREVRLPPESLVAFVIRGKESIFPTAGTTLRAGDDILALTRPKHEEELRRLFFARAGSATARPR